jgi:hypothetical protein
LIMMRNAWILAVLAASAACHDRIGPIVEDAEHPHHSPSSLALRTAEDSLLFLSERPEAGAITGLNLATSSTRLLVKRGDTVVVTITSTECAVQGGTITVSGPVQGTVTENACYSLGTVVTLGPAAYDGDLSFHWYDPTYGEGRYVASGEYPEYTVSFDDGYGDGDFNDAILSVTAFGSVAASFLYCPTVVRGNQTTCTLLYEGAVVEGWEFVDEYDQRISISSTQQHWTGTAIVSGTIRAFVQANGQPDTVETRLMVAPRDWKWGTADWTYVQGQGPICEDKRWLREETTQLAANTRLYDCTGGRTEPSVRVNPTAGFSLAQVTDGGFNDGIWYVASAAYRMDRTSYMNPQLTDSGTAYEVTDRHDVSNCQRAMGLNKNDPVWVNFYTYNEVCRGVSMSAFHTAIWRHEGFGWSGKQGHESRARQGALMPENDPHVAIEAVVAADSAFLAARVGSMVDAVDVRLSLYSGDHNYVKDHYISNNKCGSVWVWSSQGSKYIATEVKNADAGTCM